MPEEQPGRDSHDNEHCRCNSGEAQYSPPLEILAEVGELTRAGRAGSEVIDKRLRLFEGQPPRGDGLQNIGAGTATALGVGKVIEKCPAKCREQPCTTRYHS